jgi:outer membrane protein assembly factor BamD (BamD/ComL family)
MLKKYLIFCLAVGACMYFAYDFIDSGKYEDFILSHSKASWAPKCLYYLGNVFLILQKHEKAEGAYKKLIENFSASDYCERAFYNYFTIAADNRMKQEAVQRGHSFLEKFPDSLKSERIRKRLDMLEKF